MVIVNDRALVDGVGYGECVMSYLLREVVCLGTETTVGARVSHCEVQMIEIVVCSVVGSCEWGLRFGASRVHPLYTVAYTVSLLYCRLCTSYRSV